jgi:hypothetical protein
MPPERVRVKRVRYGHEAGELTHSTLVFFGYLRSLNEQIRPAKVLSQVPKSKAPGPPIFSGCAHLSRHLGRVAHVPGSELVH